MTRTGGFTLIEILIAVAIVGILAAISIPMMDDYVNRSRRAEAVGLMGEMQLRLERWRAENPSYDFSDSADEFGALPSSTYYTIALEEGDATSYTLKATARGAQVRDSECAAMTLAVDGNTETRTPADCW